MHEPSKEPDLTVEDTTKDFQYWLNRPYIGAELRKQLAAANFLVVPREGFRERTEPVFPVGTESLYDFIKNQASDGMKPDICIEDNDYRELALHSTLLIIGGFIVTSLVAPVVVNVISEYIKKKMGPDHADGTVKCDITVVDENGAAKKITYEGPATTFERTVGAAVKKMGTQHGGQKKLPRGKS